MFLLEAHALIVSYGDQRALDIPELSIKGNILALLGHNGAGKSTFIKTLLGLLAPQRGSLAAKNSGGILLSAENDMAFCPETGSVFEDISVEEYIALWCRLRHRDSKYYRTQGKHYLELLEIGPLLKKKGRELSKGQRRRVQTAIGFLTEPRLFLFDEPFDGLDVQKTQELTDIIEKQSQSTCFIISSHRMDVMERLADHALVLENGLVAASGTISETCAALAGDSILISHAQSPALLAEDLRQHFSDSLITHAGSHVSLSGPEVTLAKVEAALRGRKENDLQISRIKDSLTDSMGYHLERLALRDKEIGTAEQRLQKAA
jgi:ABC-2 type transport system ATP-binding protein